ncbi:TIGR03618 family F420-dependent PPOX class oxidoreductase [Gordonia sp. X0973]|uniref:pyridoxamine 5'-phosphate oxidase family protein n=1 Tax=Gordonia sp. X0973 TaxID=2742602 RepID=UPI000F5354FE|nr:TIGR03618 family F420-dependent PPOX class oxidoreductase [Gordonia sp. X0973]QKT07365.1 TIGR03618 family F420-dependent PPOX class oxidoreductase [Gordonia sp. X0973]
MSGPDDLTSDALTFLTERHLATLATTRTDGSPHVVAVGFTYDPDERLVRIITRDGSQKVRNADRRGRAAVTHVDGPRWLTLEGVASVSRDPMRIREAERRYGLRYREPQPNPRRVVIEIPVDRVMGSAVLLGRPAPSRD